ncbi:MAG TPA: hypothetical protein VNC78_01255 [Actinomycetota bacterium]|nr:hypothetical protein [Actinomycetota bacterium]
MTPARRQSQRYQFRVIGRFEAHLEGNENHVTVTVLAGPDWEHLSLCGTLTLTESEWETLYTGMERGMPGCVRVEAPNLASAKGI